MLRYHQLLLFLLISFSSLADTKTIEIRTIGISPYGINDKGKLSGVYYDLANQLFDDKANINHMIYPYARIVHEIKSGQTDLTIMYKYKELESYVTYVAPLPPLQNVIVSRSGKNFKSINELEGESIAYLRGASFSNEIESNSAITLYRTKNFIKSIQLLEAGRVMAVAGPFEALIMAAKRLGKNVNFFGKPLVISERTPWLQISKKSEHKFDLSKLKIKFDNKLVNNGLEKLKRTYLSENNESS